MGNIFNKSKSRPKYTYSRTYEKFDPKNTSCETILVDAIDIDTLKSIYTELLISFNRNIIKYKQHIMKSLNYILSNPETARNMCVVGYILFRTPNRGVILKIDNKGADHIFDQVGQKWFYIDIQLDDK